MDYARAKTYGYCQMQSNLIIIIGRLMTVQFLKFGIKLIHQILHICLALPQPPQLNSYIHSEATF